MWDSIEADFLRDYQIDLLLMLDILTWRRFLVLLNNLSPNGAVAVQIRAAGEKVEETTPEEDEQAAEKFFTSVVSSY